jgi:hypothetical protein
MSSPIVLCFYVFRLSVCANEIHIDVSFDHVFVSLRRHAHAASIFLCRSLARALAILLGVSSLSLSRYLATSSSVFLRRYNIMCGSGR